MTSKNLSADDELKRLKVLRGFCVLDTPSDERFDRITGLVADLFDVPIALVSLVDKDRQWFKSRLGLHATETPRDQAFCAHALPMGRDAVLVVEDASLDPRFSANPLVTGELGIRFYMGATLTAKDGSNLGTLCAIDTRPRAFPSHREIERLKTLARVVVDELELGIAQREIDEQRRLLQLAEASSGVGHWRYDLTDERLVWSEEVYRIHGVDRLSFDPNYGSAVDFYPPDDKATVNRLMEQAAATGAGFDFQLRLVRADGSLRHVVCRATTEIGAQGRTTAIFGVFQDVTEHVLALETVKESEARYRLLTENANDVVTAINPAGVFTYVSPAVTAMTGYTPQEVIGRSSLDFIDPADRAMAREQFQMSLFRGGGWRIEYRIRCKDGSALWVEARPTSVLDPNTGRLICVTDVLRDISERKALEAVTQTAREEADEKALRAANAERIAGLGHWRIGFPERTVFWSEQMFVIYGLSPSTPLEPDVILAMTHPEDRALTAGQLDDDLRGAAAESRPVIRIVRPDGTLRYVVGDTKVERDEAGRAIAMVGTLTDVTQQRETERAIAESEARYRLLAENATDMIVTSSLTGRMTYASPSCEGVTGYSPAELLQIRALDFTHPDDVPETRRVFSAVAAGGATARVRWRICHKQTREWVWLESMPALVRNPKTGTAEGFVDVIRDVTVQCEQEAALREARLEAEAATAVKSEFLANMSHELRTPLTSILGYSELLRPHVAADEKAAYYLDRTFAASEALLSIVSEVLDFSKLEAGQVEISLRPIDLRTLFGSVTEMMAPQAAAKGLALKFETTDDIPALAWIDDTRVRQVLLNYTSNALKFTEAGSVTVALTQAGGALRCEVRDTGQGIPADRMDRLFQRFSQVDASTTRSHGGTGLGLAICKGLVEAMGGGVGVNSVLGKGSTFWFELPCNPVASADPSINNDNDDQACFPLLSGLRLLVVDDNPMNRELVHLLMASVDAEISEAVNGEDAISMAEVEPFDIILMDVRMPGLSGSDAAQIIRAGDGCNSRTPIVAFTADADRSTAVTAWGGVFDGLLAKPIVAADLYAVLDALAPGAQSELMRVATSV